MISVYFPVEPDAKHITAINNLWSALSILYPCTECANELLKFIRYEKSNKAFESLSMTVTFTNYAIFCLALIHCQSKPEMIL